MVDTKLQERSRPQFLPLPAAYKQCLVGNSPTSYQHNVMASWSGMEAKFFEMYMSRRLGIISTGKKSYPFVINQSPDTCQAKMVGISTLITPQAAPSLLTESAPQPLCSPHG